MVRLDFSDINRKTDDPNSLITQYSLGVMKKSEKLLLIMSKSARYGGGIHSGREIAFMLGEKYSPAFSKFLSGCVIRGIMKRLTIDVFESVITPAEPDTVIYKIARKLRVRWTNYISLETQLSHIGEISQVLFDRVTIVTTGNSGTFKTPYGVIEFTRTKRDIKKIKDNLYFDFDIKMFRAKSVQAIADLKACKRNSHMLD